MVEEGQVREDLEAASSLISTLETTAQTTFRALLSRLCQLKVEVTTQASFATSEGRGLYTSETNLSFS